MSTVSTNPVDAYAGRVVSGEVPAGKYHRLSCARHLRDRAREGTAGFKYRFVWEDRRAGRLQPCAVRFLNFARLFNHYKGKKQWAGKPFNPTEFQVFRLGSLFGWRHVDSGFRRFTTSYNELPRKQGKSFEAALVALYVTFFEGTPGGEGYVIATKRQQATIVFEIGRQLVRRNRVGSQVLCRIEVGKHNIYDALTGSKLEPLGADSDSTDGLNPSLTVADELHAYKNRGLLDVMESATGARDNPLMFQITTAGDDIISPCGDQHDYACKILDQVFDDDATEAFFCCIAHADVEDDWLAEATWKKANPHYGLSVDPGEVRKMALKAKHMPSAAAEFQQKILNIWVNTNAPWLSLDGWRQGQTTWTVQSMQGEPCWIGIDLSSKIDLTAVVLVFPPTDTRASWRLAVWCLTPEDTLDERAHRDRAPYRQWVEKGYLATNPGNRIDQDVVLARVLEAEAMFDVQGIGIDPWNAGNLVSDLQAEGFTVVEVPQTLPQMTQPSKDFEADVLDGLVDAGGNELMTWCVSNAVVKRDDKDNIFPTKKRSRGRIDPVMAAIIARKLASAQEAPADDPELVTA